MKNTLQTFLLLILGMGSMQAVHGQPSAATTPPIKALKIGDQVPDLEFNHIVNWHQTSAKLSDFKGKLVILDFWATWCVPCVQALPKMNALQEKYKDKLMILPITGESAEIVTKLFDQNESLKGNKLPSVTKGNYTAWFPYRVIPHEVWIDTTGKVAAITGYEEITELQVEKFIKQGSIQLQEKKDIMHRDLSKPLLNGGLGDYELPINKYRYGSVFTDYIPGLPGMQAINIKRGDVVKVRCTNSIIGKLYRTALTTSPYAGYPKDLDFYLKFGNRLVWEAKDSTLYFSMERRDKFNNVPDSLKAFCYELTIPRKDSANLQKYMLEDLNRYFGSRFGIEGLREKRKINCWALQTTKDISYLNSTGGKKRVNADNNKKEITVANSTIDEFLFWWPLYTFMYKDIALINETNYTLPIDLKLDVDPMDFAAVNDALKLYGLEFKWVERELDVIVIRNVP